MAIFPIATTPPFSVASTSSIELMQEVAARETERSLISDSNTVDLTVADVSLTGQLLSSVAGISDAANVAETGAPIDNEAVIDEAQRFVDSFNALNQSGQLSTDALIEIAAETPIAVGVPLLITQEAEASGIDVVALGSNQGDFLLTLDSGALETALETDAAATTSQLAALAAPVAETVVNDLTQSTQTFALTTTAQLQLTAANVTAINVSTPQAEGPLSVPAIPVVPDLTVENAQLREALADTMLVDIVNTAAGITSTSAQISTLPLQEMSPLASATQQVQPASVVVADAQAQAAINANTMSTNTALNASSLNATTNPLPTAEATAAQVELGLTPANLVTTPIEQVTQLATNPTVAGAVAAFQVPADDGSRAGRLATSTSLDAINPIETVVETQAIGPNLANTSDQRRSPSPDARVNQWLATRPGLI